MREERQRLSKADLIEIALRQHAEIEQLQILLAELQGRLAEAEAQRDHLASVVESAKPREDMAEPALIQQRKEGEQATRDALRHLNDVAYLARSSLAELMARTHGVQPEGSDVRQALHLAIEAMKPVAGQPHESRQQRCYDILRLTYLEKEKKRAVEIAQALAISERQYYRELKAVVQAIAKQILGPWPESWQ